MSYYAVNSLNWPDEALSQEKIALRLAEISGEDLEFVTNRAFEGEYPKWPDAEEHITLISTENPSVVFTLESKGEDGDHSVSYFRDGRVMTLEVQAPPFDEEQFNRGSRPGPKQ